MMVNTMTIKTEGMYLAVYDALFPANEAGRWNEAMDLSRRQSDSEPYMQMFFLNDFWAAYANSHHLLSWPLNFDGIYRVCVSVDTSEPSSIQGQPIPFVGTEDADAVLFASSGELVIGSLYHVGQPHANTAKVPAGDIPIFYYDSNGKQNAYMNRRSDS